MTQYLSVKGNKKDQAQCDKGWAVSSKDSDGWNKWKNKEEPAQVQVWEMPWDLG